MTVDVAVLVGVVVVVGVVVGVVVTVLVPVLVPVVVTEVVTELVTLVVGDVVGLVVGDDVGVVISQPGKPPTRNSSVMMFSVSIAGQSPVGSTKNLFNAQVQSFVLSPAGPRYSIIALLIAVAVATQLARPVVSTSASYATPSN